MCSCVGRVGAGAPRALMPGEPLAREGAGLFGGHRPGAVGEALFFGESDYVEARWISGIAGADETIEGQYHSGADPRATWASFGTDVAFFHGKDAEEAGFGGRFGDAAGAFGGGCRPFFDVDRGGRGGEGDVEAGGSE